MPTIAAGRTIDKMRAMEIEGRGSVGWLMTKKSSIATALMFRATIRLGIKAIRQQEASEAYKHNTQPAQNAIDGPTADEKLLLFQGLRRRERVAQQHGDRERADAAGDGRDRAGDFSDGVEIDVAAPGRRRCG